MLDPWLVVACYDGCCDGLRVRAAREMRGATNDKVKSTTPTSATIQRNANSHHNRTCSGFPNAFPSRRPRARRSGTTEIFMFPPTAPGASVVSDNALSSALT